MHRFARAFELAVSYFAIAVLLVLVVATNSVPSLYAATSAGTTSCVPPSFYSLSITPASLNTPWSLPLLSGLEGQYTPTVSATGLPPGIVIDNQKTTLQAGGGTLDNWVLDGAPTQLGTYTITVTAQNSCGGASTVVTLPINATTVAGTTACPAGTTGAYPNCSSGTAPTVSFDQSSLTTTSANPTVTGTSNTQTINLTVQNNTGSTVYSSPSTNVVGGRWSVQLSNLVSGLYKLYLYSNGTLLVPGSLSVAVPGTSVTPATSVPQANTTTSCVAVSSTLQYASRGSDVVALQNFLISKGLLLQGSTTGYFGAQTRAAVQKFQAQQGIVSSGTEATTGFGAIGARTRAAIALVSGCGSSSTSSSNNFNAVQPVTSLPSCPHIPVPPCTGGTLLSLGVDTNHCSMGYVCKQTPGSNCPAVATPYCPNGTLISSGYDSNGCSTGYQCQQVQCPQTVQPTCSAGQHIVTAPDANGCASISYCVSN